MCRCASLGFLILSVAWCGASAMLPGMVIAAEPPVDSVKRDTPPQRPASKTWQRIQAQGTFSVSFDPDNLPYSAREGKANGFEVELAHALAKQLGLTAKIRWLQSPYETSLRHLLDSKCDLVMGLPIDPRLKDDDDPAANRILYTRPYYRAGYLIFVRKGGPRVGRLEELKGDKGSRLGAQAGTMADFALKQRGIPRKLFGTQESALKALVGGQIDYAYLWSNAAWHAGKLDNLGVEIVHPYELEDGRDMAMTVRSGDEEFRKHLEGALAELVRQKVIEQLLTRYGLPYYPPLQEKTKLPAPKDKLKP